MARRTEEHMKGLVSPGTLFEEMGFNYVGPLTVTTYQVGELFYQA